MPDEPLSIRVSDETREKFNELIGRSDFKKPGDFLSSLLSMYETENIQDEVTVRPAIEGILTSTDRAISILRGIGATLLSKDDQHKKELEEQRLSFEKTNALLQQRIEALTMDLKESEGRAGTILNEMKGIESKAEELQKQIEVLKETVSDKAKLVDEYKEKNDSLNGIITAQRGFSDENNSLKDSIHDLRNMNEQLQRQIDDMTRMLQSAETAYKTELADLKRSLEMDKDSAVLDIKKSYQDKLDDYHTKHTAAIEDLRNKYAGKIDEYENKVKSLLEEREIRKEKESRVDTGNEGGRNGDE